MEGEGPIAHHLPAVSRGVARVAQVEQLGHHPTPPGGEQQAGDRVGAAGPLRVDRAAEAQDLLRPCPRRPAGLPRRKDSARGRS